MRTASNIRAAIIGLTCMTSFGAIPGHAYPIDCAILLCLAGGFPASAECSAARAEVIRRITPWPIDPPLQIWNCPMGGAGGPPAADGGIPAEVRSYRAGIEIWLVSKSSFMSSGGPDVSASATRQYYDDAGRFQSQGVSVASVPDWVEDQVRSHAGITLSSDFGNFRAVLMRYLDHEAAPNYEWVNY
jgi:hypothetical protein